MIVSGGGQTERGRAVAYGPPDLVIFCHRPFSNACCSLALAGPLEEDSCSLDVVVFGEYAVTVRVEEDKGRGGEKVRFVFVFDFHGKWMGKGEKEECGRRTWVAEGERDRASELALQN